MALDDSRQRAQNSSTVSVLVQVNAEFHSQDRSATQKDAVRRIVRKQLIEWLERHSLMSEVGHIGEISRLNIIPFVCSKGVAKALREAPGVEAVAPADASIDLIE